MWFVLTYQLHGAYLGGTRQRTCREGVDEGLYGISTLFQLSANPAYQVNDMAVELHVLIEFHLHVMAVAAQVIACQVNKHYVFGILLGIVSQIFGIFPVCVWITRTLGGTCYGVDISFLTFYAAMCLGAGAEDAESTVI